MSIRSFISQSLKLKNIILINIMFFFLFNYFHYNAENYNYIVFTLEFQYDQQYLVSATETVRDSPKTKR